MPGTIPDGPRGHNKGIPGNKGITMQDRHTRRACLLYGIAAAATAGAWSHAEASEIVDWPPRAAVPPLKTLDLEGRAWNLAGLKGKAVLINFWASWCEPCRAEMPSLEHLANMHDPGALAVLALNFKESPARAGRFASSTGLMLPVLLDPEGDIARAWGVRVFPTTIGIAADGRPRWRVRGELDWGSPQARQMVQGLLA